MAGTFASLVGPDGRLAVRELSHRNGAAAIEECFNLIVYLAANAGRLAELANGGERINAACDACGFTRPAVRPRRSRKAP